MGQAHTASFVGLEASSTRTAWKPRLAPGEEPKTQQSEATQVFPRRRPAIAVAAALFSIVCLGHQPSSFPVHGQPPGDKITAFIGVMVVPMDGQRLLSNQVVLVRGEHIAELGPSTAVRIPAGASRIEGHGLFLLPGLADMHVHLLEGSVYFPFLLANGVTTVRNMAGGPEIRELGDRVESGAVIGPTVYTAGPILDGSPPVWEGSDVVITADEARSVVEKQKNAGYNFLKVYDNLLPIAYDAILEAAAQIHMPVAGHVPPPVGLQRVFDSHQQSIEHLTGYFEWLQSDRSPFKRSNVDGPFSHPAHLLAKRQALVHWVDESRIAQVAEATAKAGTWNVPTLVMWRNMVAQNDLGIAWKRPAMRCATARLHEWWNSDNGYSAEDWAAKRRGDAVRLKLTRALHDARARLLVSTDTPHPFVMPGFSVHEELTNFVDAGLSPYEALKAATVDAAEFMGVPGEFGVIKPGARADLILLESNPLEDVRNTSRIDGVMVRGWWLSREALRPGLEHTDARLSNRTHGL